MATILPQCYFWTEISMNHLNLSKDWSAPISIVYRILDAKKKRKKNPQKIQNY